MIAEAPMPGLIHLDLTAAQGRSLLLLATAAEDRLSRLLPDGRKRSAALHALDLLKDAVAGHQTRPMDLDLQTLAEALGDLRSSAAVDLFEARLRDLLAVVLLWRGVERAEADARGRGEQRAADHCRALLVIDEIDDVPWRGEVVDLLDDLGVGVLLPGERA